MAHRGRQATRRRLGVVLLATFLAVVVGASPPAARTALAAGTLRLQADTSYTLDPEAGRVHVEIKARAQSLKQNTATFVYFYREVAFPLQPEASRIRASDSLGAISISTKQHEFYIESVVRFRAPLYYRDVTNFTIRYDLVGGAPRSESPTRVGRAFATFGVWAWGDVGRSTVVVRTPAGYTNEVAGDDLSVSTDGNGQTLRASPGEPEDFYAIVSSENSAAYTDARLSFDGGVEVVVHAWPEDDEWEDAVSQTLRSGIPGLRALIGLDWPVVHDLNVRERYTPALEGYAGVFFESEQRIDVSEDLDPVVIVHEASHAWFNSAMFDQRWIYEGLAEEYSWRVLTGVGLDAGDGPQEPDLDDPGHVALTAWTFPEVIRDEETDDRERYGYGAAFWVIHQMVESAGVDRMREAFAAADADLTAYVGAGTPEKVTVASDWRRLLDLVEPIDEPDPVAVEEAVRAFAITETDAGALDDRGPARARYRALLEAGDGWLPPWAVRRQMGEWRFAGAIRTMEEATAVLAGRDAVAAAAGALGLEPDDALRSAYEDAQDGFVEATGIADDQLTALAALADANAKVEAAPDLIAQLGLIGESPGVPYGAARNAFEAGRLDDAASQAAVASAIVTAAPAVGQQRLIVVVVSAVGLLLALLLLGFLARRRGRRPGPTEAYATLAADPATAPPPSASPPEDEGGARA